MGKISRFAGNLLAFASNASGTERTVFGDVVQSDTLDDNINTDFLRGWGIVGVNENPTKQDFNAVAFSLSQVLAYLHQIGVPEYHASQEYQTYGITNKAGVFYISQTDSNIGNDPATDDGTDWVPLLDNALASATVTPATDADVTLTFAQYTKPRLVLADGSWASGHNIIVPDEERVYYVDNSAGTYDAAIKTAAGTGVTVAAGTAAIVACDATNVVDTHTIDSASNVSSIFPVDASVAANALTVNLDACTLDFRSSTLTDGTPVERTTGAISLTISSGSTLGTVNGVQSRIAILAIDNAGTVELAVCNLAGGTNLDETGLISTTAEGGAGGADSANVIYSTTARSNVAFRVVGFVESTQATAGTWASAPTLVQGAGGNAFVSHGSMGYGQTWQDVTGSRTLGTTYYNTTGRPIFLRIETQPGANDNRGVMTIGGAAAGNTTGNTGTWHSSNSFVVPPGASYVLNNNIGTITIGLWHELR